MADERGLSVPPRQPPVAADKRPELAQKALGALVLDVIPEGYKALAGGAIQVVAGGVLLVQGVIDAVNTGNALTLDAALGILLAGNGLQGDGIRRKL